MLLLWFGRNLIWREERRREDEITTRRVKTEGGTGSKARGKVRVEYIQIYIRYDVFACLFLDYDHVLRV